MIDVEPLIASELDRLLPLSNGSRADWNDVVERARLDGRPIALARQAPAATGRRARVGLRLRSRRVHLPPNREGSASPGPAVLLAGVGRKVVLAVVVVALIAVLATVLPGKLDRSKMTLVDQAIAAIGNGPMIHVVLDQGRNTPLVNLRTGKTTLLRSGVEVWSDPKLGTLWLATLDGKPTQRAFAPTSNTPAAFAAWRPFITGYAAQLRSGAFHLIGTGQIAGQPVDWIASKPAITTGASGEEVMEIAVSRTTYKPLYMRDRINGAIKPGSGVRVLTVETLPRQPALFAHRTVAYGPGLEGTTIAGAGVPTTLRAARAAMNPDPIIPPAPIAGLRRTWIGLPNYLAPPYNSYKDQIGGVQLYYGRLDDYGYPTYKGSYISITEFPHANTVVTFNGISLFRQDAAIITNHTIATLKTHGLYVIIQAGNQTEALKAAQALTH